MTSFGISSRRSPRVPEHPMNTQALRSDAPCPCGRGPSYAQCCARWHTGPLQGEAPDAESLMRSRYSAYALGLHDYLLQTWHPDTRPRHLAADEPGLRWLGLQVLRHDIQDADRAQVAFVARFKVGGDRAQRLTEHSRFVRVNGRWLYRDAVSPDVVPPT